MKKNIYSLVALDQNDSFNESYYFITLILLLIIESYYFYYLDIADLFLKCPTTKKIDLDDKNYYSTLLTVFFNIHNNRVML